MRNLTRNHSINLLSRFLRRDREHLNPPQWVWSDIEIGYSPDIDCYFSVFYFFCLFNDARLVRASYFLSQILYRTFFTLGPGFAVE